VSQLLNFLAQNWLVLVVLVSLALLGYVLRQSQAYLARHLESLRRELEKLQQRLVHLGDENTALRQQLETVETRFTADQLTPLLNRLDDHGRRAWQAAVGVGWYSGFLGDVARAWQVASELNREAALVGRPIPAVAAEVRWALIRLSVQTQAGAIPPALIAAALRAGRWSPGQVLSLVRVMPGASQGEALCHLTPWLPGEMLPHALALAEGIVDREKRGRTLAAVVASLPIWQDIETLQQLLPACEAIASRGIGPRPSLP
jgi:hypothetical protein